MTQATKPAPLGRGLSALFGDADASYQTKGIVMQGPQEKRGTQNIPTGALKPGPYQPRRNFNDEALKELAASVRERGILQPILVRPDKSVPGHYEIIAGERRWRAAQLAKLHEVPVVIRSLSDSEALEYGLIENVQRQDLTTLEEADGYQRLLDEFGHTQEGLSKIVGKRRSHVANILRHLSLPAEVKQHNESGQLSAGHARALVTAADPLALAREIVRRGLNVRQAEALAKAGMPAE
ncbi:MAG: ParB/RepB/Spo0J family partition protein, partial [Bdellovibrionales bacterium]